MAARTLKKLPLDSLARKGFDILYVSHAAGILAQDFPAAVAELEPALSDLELPITEIIGSGGGETKFTQRLRKGLAAKQWKKHVFEITKTVDGVPRESTSHEVDHVRRFPGIGVIAMEIEWNNKDPFFDRDLENFKRLHAEGAISVGVLITRGSSLQVSLRKAVRRFAEDRAIGSFADLARNGYVPTPKQAANVMRRVERQKGPIAFADAWTDNFVSNKYGQATTHWGQAAPPQPALTLKTVLRRGQAARGTPKCPRLTTLSPLLPMVVRAQRVSVPC